LPFEFVSIDPGAARLQFTSNYGVRVGVAVGVFVGVLVGAFVGVRLGVRVGVLVGVGVGSGNSEIERNPDTDELVGHK
jgi:hypothetical protein